VGRGNCRWLPPSLGALQPRIELQWTAVVAGAADDDTPKAALSGGFVHCGALIFSIALSMEAMLRPMAHQASLRS
jgi:hypothetical protein